MSIIPRAKVKELPFAVAEDLKARRAGGRMKESGDLRERKKEKQTRGKKRGEKKKEKGVVGVDRYLPISETITILLPVVAEASGPGR